jgi:predicted nuclease of predicted toxin-antitoxin system
MRILLDECLPNLLRRELTGHQAITVQKMGWSGVKNGALLTLAEGSFDVFLTVDRNIQYQQNVTGKNIALVVLIAFDNQLETLKPLVPNLLAALQNIQPGQVIMIQP